MPEGRSLPAACTRTSAYVQVMLWAVVIICAALWSSAAACGNLNISRPAAYLSAMADFPQDYCIESAGHLSPGDSTLDARCILHVWFSIMGDTLSQLLRQLDQGGRLYRDVENLFNYANSIQIDCVSVDENTCSLSALVHKEAITPSYFRALMLKSFQAVRFMNGQPGAVPATVLARWLPTESAAQLGKACVCSEVCRPATETTSAPVSSQTNVARAAGKVGETEVASERLWGLLVVPLGALCATLAALLWRRLGRPAPRLPPATTGRTAPPHRAPPKRLPLLQTRHARASDGRAARGAVPHGPVGATATPGNEQASSGGQGNT
ncbi:uncharacterized protein LOC142930498 isoform X1 [Petromyzon marinus]|uniref:uncharacterized protein LOC142930498 isoform X1 n=1 Tax=Petromyzon marinus TaxID=7757 RepID=UPI003F730AE6